MVLNTLLDRHSLISFNYFCWSLAGLVTLSSLWAKQISKHIALPYLDEVFHVRQTQKYCDGRFAEWDPKITTPPGLYLLLSLASYVFRAECSVKTLRAVNACFLPCLVFPSSMYYLYHCGISPFFKAGKPSSAASSQITRYHLRTQHVSFNICLFPLIFFFSGLCYTDVASTGFVLLQFMLKEVALLHQYPFLRGALLLLNGMIAVTFRQTNILWVAVFPAILDVVSSLKPVDNELVSLSYLQARDTRRIMQTSWDAGRVYDVPFSSACLSDCVLIPLSTVAASLRKIYDVALAIWQYLALMLIFAAFVAWNGGIVLGDKANHVATIHLAQMLYIWPLIIFFSFPLILSRLYATIMPTRLIPSFLSRYRIDTKNSRSASITLVLLFATLLVVLGIIRYNTIIHPFILADNRHYVFYVFRILRSHKSVKFLVAPIYMLCSYLVLQLFCSPTSLQSATLPPDVASHKSQKSSKDTNMTSQHANAKTSILPSPTMTSYVLAWLLTTTLTLITAPLVEPRYFILPWVFWRLQVPGPPEILFNEPSKEPSSASSNTSVNLTATFQYFTGLLDHKDPVLFLETAWFLIINIVTGYIFLYWGFQWPQEPGNVQRFMW